MNAQLDHRVVVARTLDEGVQWCEATLGITPGAGGEPPRFGKHNRLFRKKVFLILRSAINL